MLKTARYAATPHAVARNHKIPIDVIEFLSGKREQDAPTASGASSRCS